MKEMIQIEKLPVDMDTWQQLNYDSNYYVNFNTPLNKVANSVIKMYENQLNQFSNLSEEDREIFEDNISRIRNIMNY